MTTKTDQEVAEKWAIDNQFIIGPEHPQWDAYCKISHWVIERMASAFLAGCLHKGTPMKIDPNDQSTWPPMDVNILCYNYFRNEWDIDNLNYCLEAGAGFFTYYGVSHWLPLPEVEG